MHSATLHSALCNVHSAPLQSATLHSGYSATLQSTTLHSVYSATLHSGHGGIYAATNGSYLHRFPMQA